MNLNFSDLNLILPLLWSISICLTIFLNSNVQSSFNKALADNAKQSIRVKKYVNIKTFYYLIRYPLLLNIIDIFFFRSLSNSFFWNNFIYSNYAYSVSVMVLLTLILFYTYTTTNVLTSSVLPTDFIFSIATIILISPMVFFSSNMVSFIFLLEVISCLILYNFIISSSFFKKKESSFFFKLYLNALFYQYWSVFFSTILLFYFLCNILYIFGMSDWSLINSLTLFLTLKLNYYQSYIFIIFFSFFFSFFFKVGVAPTHLFKLEVYKGLPYYTIFMYTIVYLVIYLFFFIQIFLINLGNLYILISPAIFLILILGALFLAINLFNNSCLKSFFAYSGIINVLVFLNLTLSFLN